MTLRKIFKLMNNAVFGKTSENVRKHRDIKLETTDKKRSQLAARPNYHTAKHFFRRIDSYRNGGGMNKPIYLGFSILEIGKL